ncbi:hypothetical protein M0R04_13820 [Candidatus Dojkabacteria bacterium]|jgi:hypothetical protein|nr:hypothetical protein [Candidatus Dojkabacteria bacterium]
MKLPQDNKQIVVTNGINSIQGYLAYTKNIDLDEKGYIKLAPPMCNVFSDVVAEGGDANLDLPVELFPYGTGSFKVITNDRAFNVNIASMSFSEDTGYTGWIPNSRVIIWVGGLWHIAGGAVYSYTGADGDSVYASVISKQLDFAELFVNKNTIVGGVGDNVVWQYNTSYANTTNLTIPASFVITGLSYSNQMIGVATRSKKNQGNAYFYTWDGATVNANSCYPINDSFILSVKAYKSSWVLFTSAGQLLYFNGGGFTELGSIPTFRFEDDLIDLGPANSIDLGDIMTVDGDVVYVNVASTPQFSQNNKPYRYGFSGGVYCYDPEVGFYHRFAPSYSQYVPEDVTASSDILTFAASHYLATGDEVWLKATDLGLTGQRVYYAIVLNTTTIKLADTYDEAIANTALDITDGTLNNLFYVKRKDYGIESLRVKDLGVVRKMRTYDGYDDTGVMPTFLGASVIPNDVTTARVNTVNATIPQMSNRGYFITSKFQTNNFSDNWQGIAVKYAKLSPQSSIIVKAKVEDKEPIVVGDMTLYADTYSGSSITWDANGYYFETTADLSEAEVGDEVHIFAGAGAGQSAHITIITLVGSTYQVTLDETIRGIITNAKSCITIDKWIKLGTISASDTDGFKYLPLAQPSPTLEIKCELRGIGVKIGEVLPIRSTQIPAE